MPVCYILIGKTLAKHLGRRVGKHFAQMAQTINNFRQPSYPCERYFVFNLK